LAFRGHDESEESTNNGNFKELVKLLAEENENAKKVVRKAPKNNKMTALEIQRDIANCFAEVREYPSFAPASRWTGGYNVFYGIAVACLSVRRLV
jgi:hypothetical protein